MYIYANGCETSQLEEMTQTHETNAIQHIQPTKLYLFIY